MAEVRVSGLNLSFGSTQALRDVTLTFPEGGFFGLLGPSGSGKTTLLRCVAGFVFPQGGSVSIGDEPVQDVPVEKREIGMVFQNYALFPNMSVAENIAFGLRVRRMSGQEVKRRVSAALELVQLDRLGDRRPHQLSGGQGQRVALARAIVTEPRVLLLDEPLSALDKSLRVDMQIELKRIQREVGVTTIFVTHDQEEALTLSDRIGILRDGRLVQEGEPRQVYNAPVNEFAASFLGEANILRGSPESGGLRLSDGALISASPDSPAPLDKIAVRPENMMVSSTPPEPRAGLNALQARLERKIFAGATATCLLEWRGERLKVLAKDEDVADLPENSEVWLSWPAERSIVMDSD